MVSLAFAVLMSLFTGGMVLHRVWKSDIYVQHVCADTFFGKPQVLDDNHAMLSLFVMADRVPTHEAVGRVLDANLTRNFFVVGCSHQLQWKRFLYAPDVLVYGARCELEKPFNELNLYFIDERKPDMCVSGSHLTCLKLLGSEFVCVDT